MFAHETKPTEVAAGVVRLGTDLVNWYLVEDEGLAFAEDVRKELGIPVYVHRADEQLTTTRKAFGKNEASMVPYFRYPMPGSSSLISRRRDDPSRSRKW